MIAATKKTSLNLILFISFKMSYTYFKGSGLSPLTSLKSLYKTCQTCEKRSQRYQQFSDKFYQVLLFLFLLTHLLCHLLMYI